MGIWDLKKKWLGGIKNNKTETVKNELCVKCEWKIIGKEWRNIELK